MNQEVKELLYKQLQLLAEESKKGSIADDLFQYTMAMCTIADRILAVTDASDCEIAIDAKEVVKDVVGAIRGKREDT